MADDQPKAEDVERMNHIERETVRWIGQWRENTEAAIVAGALLRIVRHLYDLYPEAVRAELVEGAIAFVQGRDIEAQARRARFDRLPRILDALNRKH